MNHCESFLCRFRLQTATFESVATDFNSASGNCLLPRHFYLVYNSGSCVTGGIELGKQVL